MQIKPKSLRNRALVRRIAKPGAATDGSQVSTVIGTSIGHIPGLDGFMLSEYARWQCYLQNVISWVLHYMFTKDMSYVCLYIAYYYLQLPHHGPGALASVEAAPLPGVQLWEGMAWFSHLCIDIDVYIYIYVHMIYVCSCTDIIYIYTIHTYIYIYGFTVPRQRERETLDICVDKYTDIYIDT